MANFSRSSRQLDLPVLLPTSPDELADLLMTHSYDWAVCLDFLEKVALRQGNVIDTVSVSELIRQQQGGYFE